MSISYTPLGSRIIVKKIESEETKIGSILIPGMAEKLSLGEVVGVGIGDYAMQTGVLMPCECRVGQKVLFLKEGAFVPLSVNGEWLLLMRESSVEAIVNE